MIKKYLSVVLALAGITAGAASIGVYGEAPIQFPSQSDLARIGLETTNYVNSSVVQVAESNPTAAQYEVFRMILADLWDKYERLSAFEGYDNVEDAVVSVLQDVINELRSGMTNYVTTATLNSRLNSYVPTSRTINGKNLTANRSLSASDVGAVSESGGSVYSMGTISDGSTEYFYPSYAFKTYYYESAGSFSLSPSVFEDMPVYIYLYPTADGTLTFQDGYYYDLAGARQTSETLTADTPMVFELVRVYYDAIIHRVR